MFIALETLRKVMDMEPASAYQKWVLAVLAMHDGNNGTGIHPSIATITKITLLDRKTVLKALKELEAGGFVECIRSIGKPSHFKILDRCSSGSGTGKSSASESESGTATSPKYGTSSKDTSPINGTTTSPKYGTPTCPKYGTTPVPNMGHEVRMEERKEKRKKERNDPSASIDAPGLSASFFSNLPSELTRGSDEERWVMMAAYNDASRVDLEIDEVHSAWSKFAQWHSSYKTERTAKDAWVNWVGKERAWRR